MSFGTKLFSVATRFFYMFINKVICFLNGNEQVVYFLNVNEPILLVISMFGKNNNGYKHNLYTDT